MAYSSQNPDHLEAHIQGAVVCTACESVYQIEDRRLSCANCNAPLELAEEKELAKPRRDIGAYSFLKPLADLVDSQLKSGGMLANAGRPSLKQQVEGSVTCGWCATRYPKRPPSPNCESCGGVLPLPASVDPGPQPPPAPRQLPSAFGNRLFFKQNLGGWIGVLAIVLSVPLFCAIGPFTLLVFLFGLAAAHSNFLTAYRRHLALRQGTPVLGRIESVHLIGERGEGAPMYRVHYRFEHGDEPLRGMKYTYDEAITNHFVGEPVWVVYLPNKPACNDLWPPLA